MGHLLWLWVLLIQVYVCFGCWNEERIALFHLKASFNVSDYRFPSWKGYNESDCCVWERVECSPITKRLTKLSLDFVMDWPEGETVSDQYYMNASLFLPFKELTSLDLSFNYLLGFVENEALNGLTNLQVLDLWGNNFNKSVFQSLGRLSSLRELILGSNNMEGSITGLNGLTNLQVLHLSWNKFNKSVLQSLGRLPSLRELSLGGNNMKGSITGLNGFTNLQVLDLSENYFNKSVLQSLGRLSSLRELNLLDNKMEGSISRKDYRRIPTPEGPPKTKSEKH